MKGGLALKNPLSPYLPLEPTTCMYEIKKKEFSWSDIMQQLTTIQCILHIKKIWIVT